MNPIKCIEFFRVRLRAVTYVCIGMLGGLVALDIIPGLIPKDQAHTQLERLPAFWCVFGFLGCGLLIVISKLYGRAGIVRSEDYYDRHSQSDLGQTKQ